MKNWVDLTIWPHIGYRYTPEGKVVKLLEGKTAKVFATCGGPSWYYYIPFVLPLKTFWQTCVFNHCGIDLVDFEVCGNLDKWIGEKRDKHLAKFIAKIKRKGESR
jgi:putative NADPH-quinone reductase